MWSKYLTHDLCRLFKNSVFILIVNFFMVTRYQSKTFHFTSDTQPATNVFSYVCNFVCITHQLSINHVFVVFNDPTTIIDSSKPQSYIHFFFTHTPRTVRVIFFNVVISHKKAIDGYWLFSAFYMSWRRNRRACSFPSL